MKMSRSGEAPECGSDASSPASCASDAAPATLLGGVKLEPGVMPPGGPDVRDYYAGVDADVFLARPFSPDRKGLFHPRGGRDGPHDNGPFHHRSPEDKGLFDPRRLRENHEDEAILNHRSLLDSPEEQGLFPPSLHDYRPAFQFHDDSLKPPKSPDGREFPFHHSNGLRCGEEAELPLPEEVEVRDGGVFARAHVPSGTKYGPYLGKWEAQPLERRFAWEVISRNGVHGWLDATTEQSNWLKFIRSTNHALHVNVQHILLAGQVWYRVSRDVRAGQELLLAPRAPLPLQDVLAAAAHAPGAPVGGRFGEAEAGAAGAAGAAAEAEAEEEEHEDSEPRCSVCDSAFPDIDSLDLHQVREHRQQAGACPCDRCPRAYSSRALLLRHRALAHSDLRKYSCENCPKVFTDPSNLQRHIRAQHPGARSHACPECGKTFATSSGLKQHTHIHSSVKPFQCEVCFKSYTQFSNLCRHKRMHSNCRSQIKCGKCGATFSTITSLTKHKRFCDSAGTGPSVNLPSQLPHGISLPHIPGMANPNNTSPFPMYRPTLPFPFNTFHYPGLFPSAGPPGFLNPLLLPHNARMLEQSMEPKLKRRRLSIASIESIEDTIKTTDVKALKSLSDVKTDRLTPTRPQILATKISPPTAEEASSHLRPSPARPNLTPAAEYNLTREELRSSPFDLTNKVNNNDQPLDMKRVPSPKDMPLHREMSTEIHTSDESDAEEEIAKGVELPLDLSVSRKRRNSECVIVDTEADSALNALAKSFSPPESPDREPSATPDNNSDAEVDVENEEPRPASSRPHTPHSSPPVAYPRPVHPALLEAMYSRQGFPTFRTPSGEPLLAPSHSPYVPFNFLSPLLGVDSGDRADMLRAPGAGYAKFRELSGGGGKLRDRYACKYCGKVFPRSANLTRHLRTHTGEQPYKCKYCERSFSISSNLQRHVRNIHNKERPFRCPLCERCFGQQTNLDRHLKKHEAEGADSPSSADTEREDTYFDEIRSFMGKVGCSPPSRSPSAPRSPHPTLRPSALAVST